MYNNNKIEQLYYSVFYDFSVLYNPTLNVESEPQMSVTSDIEDIEESYTSSKILNQAITTAEVQEALKYVNRGRACGMDNVLVEVLCSPSITS